ncbi:hypothetical protein D3C85_1265410 [compost metagenome]
MHAVIAKRARNTRKVPFQTHVGDLQQTQRLRDDRFAQLDRRQARLWINAASMRRAHDEIHIPHNFGENNAGNPAQLDRLIRSAIHERDGLQGRRLDLRRREPIRERIHLRDDVLFVVDLLQAFLVADGPQPCLQQRSRPLRLDLMTGVTPRHRAARQFIAVREIQLPEHLLERLLQLPVEQKLLIAAPLTALIQMQRMCDINRIRPLQRDGFASRPHQSAVFVEAEGRPHFKHQHP